MSEVLKVLFIPVSAAKGSGEYQRSLLLANELKDFFGDKIDIRFVINAKAIYAKKVPYQTYSLNASATVKPKELHKILAEFKPDLALFDSAGRVKSYRCAKKLGCKVALVVSRPKKRSKALSLRVAKHLDLVISTSHLPNLCRLTLKEKVTQAIHKKLKIVLVNALFKSPNISNVNSSLPFSDKYCFLFLTGGKFIYNNIDVPTLTKATAEAITSQNQLNCVIIDPKINDVSITKNVISIPMQSNENFINLIAQAESCVVGTGAVAAQVLALNKPSIMVATSKTGEKYLADYQAMRVTETATLSANEIANKVKYLLNDKNKLRQLENRQKNTFSNGLESATQAIKELLLA